MYERRYRCTSGPLTPSPVQIQAKFNHNFWQNDQSMYCLTTYHNFLLQHITESVFFSFLTEVKELNQLFSRSNCPRPLRSVDDGLGEPSESWWREEVQASLQQSLRDLQTQLATERAQRAESEREAEMFVMENAMLEQEVARMEFRQVGVL